MYICGHGVCAMAVKADERKVVVLFCIRSYSALGFGRFIRTLFSHSPRLAIHIVAVRRTGDECFRLKYLQSWLWTAPKSPIFYSVEILPWKAPKRCIPSIRRLW